MACCRFCGCGVRDGERAHMVCMREQMRRCKSNMCTMCGRNKSMFNDIWCSCCMDAARCGQRLYVGYPAAA